MKTNEFFDRYATDFSDIYGNQNSLWSSLLNRYFRESMQARFRLTLDQCDFTKGNSVLDVGCGPGHYSIALAQKGFNSVSGIDFSASMIKLAEEKATKANLSDKCSFLHANFDDFKSPHTFDYTVLMGFMDYAPDPVAVIQRALSLTNRKSFFSFPDSRGFLAWLRRIRYKKRCDLYMYDADEIRKLFESAGYPDIILKKISRDYFVTVIIKE